MYSYGVQRILSDAQNVKSVGSGAGYSSNPTFCIIASVSTFLTPLMVFIWASHTAKYKSETRMGCSPQCESEILQHIMSKLQS